MLKQRGLTIVELMVTLVIASVVMISIIAAYTSGIYHASNAMNSARLQQALQTAMDYMINDIRRAGYWGNARSSVGADTNANPFMAVGADVTINGANNCILYTYDSNGNGTLAAVNSGTDDEHYGFRLNGSAIQIKPLAGSYNCTSNDWTNLTDPTVVNITALTFSMATYNAVLSGGHTLSVRNLTITITGSLTGDAGTSMTLTDQVRLANDKFN